MDGYLRSSFVFSNDATQCRRSNRLQRKHKQKKSTWRRGDFSESELETETESESELKSESSEEDSSHQTSESEISESEGLGEEHMSIDSTVGKGKMGRRKNSSLLNKKPMPKKLKDATQIEGVPFFFF